MDAPLDTYGDGNFASPSPGLGVPQRVSTKPLVDNME